MDLTPENIFGLLRSTDEFPVDFEDAWRWIGYSRKDTAVDALKLNCIQGVDFNFQEIPEVRIEGRRRVTRNVDRYSLSIDGFKMFAASAGTPRGREVRVYLINCERRLKELLQERRANQKQRVVRAVVQGQADPWEKRYEDEFFDEAYRITGWKRSSKGHAPCMGTFINKTVYDYFPEGVPERLRQVNPKNEKGRRSRKHHQHLTPTLGLPVLATQKAATIAVMRLSPSNNLKRFEENMTKACGSQIQIELPFMEDLNQLDEAS